MDSFEKEKLLKSSRFSSHGSIASDLDSGNIKESAEDYRRRWFCLGITYLGTFTTFIQSSLYWTSMWPYLTQVDPTTPASFFGLVISAYSFGSVLAAPLLGYWSNRTKSTRWPIVTGFIINIFGNLLMAFVETFPTNSRRYVLLAARFVAGFGSGNNGVSLAYLSHASTLDERNRVMSYQAATFSCAVLLGPGFAAAMTPLGYPGVVWGPIHLDMYTLGAYMSILLSIVCLGMYLGPYREYNISVSNEEENSGSYSYSAEYGSLKPVDRLAAFCCILIRFVMLFCVTYGDTVGSPLTMAMFSWTRSDAVLYNGIITAIAGIFDFFGNILVGMFLLKFVHERTTILFGLPCFALYYVISFAWPGLPAQNLGPKFYLSDNTRSTTMSSRGVISRFPNFTTSTSLAPASTIAPDMGLGCNFDWCPYTSRISVAQYVIAFVFMTTAFVSAFGTTSTLFSKIIGKRRQGTWQGVYTASGSLAMAISPIFVSYLFEYSGPRVAWGFAFGLLCFATGVVLVCWRRLVPNTPNMTMNPRVATVSHRSHSLTMTDKSSIVNI